MPQGASGIVVTTYTMVAFGGKRSDESLKIMQGNPKISYEHFIYALFRVAK